MRAYERIGQLPFDHERQLASVVVRSKDGLRLITKGAPEAVLARCVGVPESAASVLDGLFADGARVIAVATRSGSDRLRPLPQMKGICS